MFQISWKVGVSGSGVGRGEVFFTFYSKLNILLLPAIRNAQWALQKSLHLGITQKIKPKFWSRAQASIIVLNLSKLGLRTNE